MSENTGMLEADIRVWLITYSSQGHDAGCFAHGQCIHRSKDDVIYIRLAELESSWLELFNIRMPTP